MELYNLLNEVGNYFKWGDALEFLSRENGTIMIVLLEFPANLGNVMFAEMRCSLDLTHKFKKLQGKQNTT